MTSESCLLRSLLLVRTSSTNSEAHAHPFGARGTERIQESGVAASPVQALLLPASAETPQHLCHRVPFPLLAQIFSLGAGFIASPSHNVTSLYLPSNMNLRLTMVAGDAGLELSLFFPQL